MSNAAGVGSRAPGLNALGSAPSGNPRLKMPGFLLGGSTPCTTRPGTRITGRAACRTQREVQLTIHPRFRVATGLLPDGRACLPLAVLASVPLDTRHITFEGIPASRLLVKPACPRSGSVERVVEDVPYPVDGLSAWVLQRAGVNPDAYRAISLLRRVPACLRQLRVASPEAALRLLQQDAGSAPRLLDALLIGVSGFFRDPAVFALLEQTVLPELLAARGGALRVVSAGASSGQELYSVAMLLVERGALATSSLRGIDCRPAAIQQAREAVYLDAELEGLSVARRMRFVRSENGRHRLVADLRTGVEWCRGDVLSHREEEPCDLVLFRNVAIYLERSHADQAWARLTDTLRPGGMLVTGKAEMPPSWLPFERVAPCVFRRRSV